MSDIKAPRIGTYWRNHDDGLIYEVIGHDLYSPFNVVLRPWLGMRYEAANRFHEGADFHRYTEVTDELRAEFAAREPASQEA